jgi:hypothetical protein
VLFERGAPGERVLQGLATLVVLLGLLVVLPVVGVVFQVLAPVELVEAAVLFDLESGVARLGRRPLNRRLLIAVAVPFGLGRRHARLGLGRQQVRLGARGGIGRRGHPVVGRGRCGAALLDHLEQRIGFQFALNGSFQFGQGQLQYFDRLLELRRHHQLLPQPQVLS